MKPTTKLSGASVTGKRKSGIAGKEKPMVIHEAKGHKRGKKRRELHHLEIHGHPDGTPDAPKWLVVHDFGPEHESAEHAFSDHEEMLDHVRRHSGTEPVADDLEGE